MTNTDAPKIAALERENAALLSRVAHLETENADLRSKSGRLATEVGELRRRIDAMTNGAVPDPLPPALWTSVVEYLPMADVRECSAVCRAFLNTIVPSADLGARGVTLHMPHDRQGGRMGGAVHYKAGRFRGVGRLSLQKGHGNYADFNRKKENHCWATDDSQDPVMEDELRGTFEALGRPNSVRWLEIWDVGYCAYEEDTVGSLGPDCGRNIVPYLEKVEELVLHLNCAKFDEIARFVMKLPHLAKLSVYFRGGDVGDVDALGELHSLPNLCELRLHSSLHYHTETDLGAAVSKLTGLRRLETNMLGNKHSECCEMLTSLTCLYSLTIRCPLQRFWPMLIAAGGCPNVKKLTIGCGRNVSEDSIPYIVDMDDLEEMVYGSIEAFPCLEVVSIYFFGFGTYRGGVEWDEENLAEILSGFNDHPTLKKIEFSCQYRGMPEDREKLEAQLCNCGTELQSQLDNVAVCRKPRYLYEEDDVILM